MNFIARCSTFSLFVLYGRNKRKTGIEYISQSTTNNQRFSNLFISARYSTYFRRLFPSIISSTKLVYHFHTIQSSSRQQYWSDKYLTLYLQFCATDGGQKNRLKHVERLTEINKFEKRCILLVEL